jgi:formylglycine-generating enzyme required for sulfatase activity
VDYYKNSPSKNPKGPLTGNRRSARGGSWFEPEESLCCPARASFPPQQKSVFISFRVVKSVN